jgi:hypothetical protein
VKLKRRAEALILPAASRRQQAGTAVTLFKGQSFRKRSRFIVRIGVVDGRL